MLHFSGGCFARIFVTGVLPVAIIIETALSVDVVAVGWEPGSSASRWPAARVLARLGPGWLAGAGGEGQAQVLSECTCCTLWPLLHECRANVRSRVDHSFRASRSGLDMRVVH